MPLPLVIWAVAGLGAAGVKIYKDATSVENITKTAISNFRDAKYRLEKREGQLLLELQHLSDAKLTAWSGYARMFAVLRKIEKRPEHLSYKSHENFALTAEAVERLTLIAELVEAIKEKKLNKIGTGLTSVLALQGGAATKKGEDAIEKKVGPSALEVVMQTPMDVETLGLREEWSVLNAILCTPHLVEEQELDELDCKNMDKEAAIKLKTKLDTLVGSVDELIDRISRLEILVGNVATKLEQLRVRHWETIAALEKLVTTKTNYQDFSQEEKDLMAYGIIVGLTMRQLAKIDLVLSDGNITVVNAAPVHECIEETRDLLPIADVIK